MWFIKKRSPYIPYQVGKYAQIAKFIGQYGAHLGMSAPGGPHVGPHEPCYLSISLLFAILTLRSIWKSLMIKANANICIYMYIYDFGVVDMFSRRVENNACTIHQLIQIFPESSCSFYTVP